MSTNIESDEKDQIQDILTITEEETISKEHQESDAKIILDLSDDSSCLVLDDSVIEKVNDQEPPDENDKSLDENKSPLVVESKTDDKPVVANENATGQEAKHIWVSNITRHIKANDLKKYFGQHGRVVTAKILTNGKSFYGYISMETPEQAMQCIKELNNSNFEGNTILVSKNRPEIKKVTAENPVIKPKPRKRSDKKKSVEVKIANKNETKEGVEEKKDKKPEDAAKNIDDKKMILDLERKLRNAYADISKFKRKLDECDRKILVLERNSRKDSDRLRTDRRRLNQDKEDFEKAKKAHQKQMSNEKTLFAKELDEVKALRLKLQNRLDNFITNTPRTSRKSRSPVLRDIRNAIDKTMPQDVRRYQDRSSRSVKRPRRENQTKVPLSPPSPPGISDYDRRANAQRNDHTGSHRNEHFTNSRPYYSDERKHAATGKAFDYRYETDVNRYGSENRSSFPQSYTPKDPRRSTAQVQAFVSDRFGGGIPKPPSMLGPSRSGHTFFTPQYGHY